MKNNIIVVVDTIQFLKLKKDYLFDDKSIRIDIKELLKVGKISSQSYSDATNRICRHGNFKDQYKFYYAVLVQMKLHIPIKAIIKYVYLIMIILFKNLNTIYMKIRLI